MPPVRSIVSLGVLVLCITAPVLGDDPKNDVRQRELDRHQGTWRVISFMSNGVKAAPEVAGSIIRIVESDHVVWKRDGKSFAGTTIEIDPSREPKSIDVIPEGGPSRGKRVLGIYELDGDDLRICMAGPERDRPKRFEAEKASGQTLMTFKRMRE